MVRFWTCHWRFCLWRPGVNWEGEPIRFSGSNQYARRGIASGRNDKAYIVSIWDGQLYVVGA